MTQIYALTDNGSITLQVKLHEVSEKCDRVELKHNLIETMNHYQGIGLSANQCGVMERVFVMYEDFRKREIVACFNPNIIISSTDTVLMDEGCLTYPGLWLKVSRPETVQVVFEDEFGETQKRKYSGLEARVFQHEMDHMEGTNFTKRVSKLKLDMAKKRAAKMKKKANISKT